MPFLGNAEKLFRETEVEGRKKAKRWAKPKIHGIGIGWLSMKPDEVIAELEKMGVKITRRTLLNYEKWGLIPEPKRGGAGKGKGRTTDYPDDTPAEAYAAWCLMHSDFCLSPEAVARYRKEKKGNLFLKDFWDFHYWLAWLAFKALAKYGYIEAAKYLTLLLHENAVDDEYMVKEFFLRIDDMLACQLGDCPDDIPAGLPDNKNSVCKFSCRCIDRAKVVNEVSCLTPKPDNPTIYVFKRNQNTGRWEQERVIHLLQEI